MDTDFLISPPQDQEDTEGAQRVFEEFLVLYQPVLSDVDSYLENIMDKMGGEYAKAYQPWHRALQDLMQGVYLTVKKIPLPDPESFIDALKLFRFDSALQFLYDLYLSCRSNAPSQWIIDFKKHIDMLLFSAAILLQSQKQVLAR